MAKLSAYGRTELARYEIMRKPTEGEPYRVQVAFMSDRNLLRKIGKGGWQRLGKIREDLTLEQWEEKKKGEGWTKVK